MRVNDLALALVCLLWPGCLLTVVASPLAGVGGPALTGQQIVTVAEPTTEVDLHYPEPHFATNPEDPSQIVLGSMAVRPDREWTVRVFRSADGGVTWHHTALPELGELRCWGDPWVAWGDGETAYLVCLTRRPRSGEDGWDAAALFYRTDDAGATWREPLLVPDDEVRGSWDHAIARRAPGGDVIVVGTRSRVGPDGFAIARSEGAKAMGGRPV